MLKIFRKTRQSMLKNNKITAYLLYALGEVILVMIGILLALQVNNWNEDRKANNELISILKTIKSDLKIDTLNGSRVIRYYDTINKYSNKVINNEYNNKNIEECITCRNILTGYNPFNIQKKGFKLLQNYSESKSEKTDSLITDLSQFYTFFDAMIINNNEMIKSETLTNLNYFKKQDWFIPWMQGKMTDEMKMFFGTSLNYKNRVAANNILVASNHQNYIKIYKRNADDLLNRIDKRLKINIEETTSKSVDSLQN